MLRFAGTSASAASAAWAPSAYRTTTRTSASARPTTSRAPLLKSNAPNRGRARSAHRDSARYVGNHDAAVLLQGSRSSFSVRCTGKHFFFLEVEDDR